MSDLKVEIEGEAGEAEAQEAAEAAANAALAAAGVTTVEGDISIDGSNGYGEASGSDVIEASADRKSTSANNKKTKKKRNSR